VFYFDSDSSYFILWRIVCIILLCVDVDVDLEVVVVEEVEEVEEVF
jgi:hypothetical protein